MKNRRSCSNPARKLALAAVLTALAPALVAGQDGPAGARPMPLPVPEGRGLPIDPLARCRTFSAQASREAVAVSPRADVVAERLAIAMGGTFAADPALYDRVAADLATIRSAEPALAALGYRGRNDGRSVQLKVDAETMRLMRSQGYLDWYCTNLYYGESAMVFVGSTGVLLTFRGVFDTDRLAAEYARLPGVATASSTAAPAPAVADICGTAISGTHYYVVEVLESCGAGCTAKRYVGFSSTPGSPAAALGSWRTEDGSKPSWLASYAGCFAIP